jgi:putative DNA primase/helicase
MNDMGEAPRPSTNTDAPFSGRQCIVDTETYPNFSMIGVRIQEPGQEHRVLAFTSEPDIGETFDAFRDWYADNGQRYLWIGFNSLQYGNHIIASILEGDDYPATLKALSDELISTSTPYYRPSAGRSAGGETCLDLLAINSGANAKVGSLKEIACKLDAPSLRELPYEPGRVLTRDEMQVVVDYNANDLEVTSRVAAHQDTRIMARVALAREFRVRDVLNAYDAKLVELILAHQIFGKAPWEYPKPWATWTLVTSRVTDLFTFQTPAIQEMVARIPEMIQFRIEKNSEPKGPRKKIVSGGTVEDTIKVGDITYNFGEGGLHSKDEPGLFIADDRWTYWDCDVDSFYPALMVNHRLAPAHLSTDEFLEAYDTLRHRRLAAKKAGEKALADGLKVAINSIFGRSKLASSWICDPTINLTTTLLGQLTLFTLIDILAGAEGVEVISANTDGLFLKVRRDRVGWVRETLDGAVAAFDLTLSWAEYKLLARRDISNYIAVTTDGAVKAKGAYGRDPSDLGKKATNRIVVRAAQAFFVDGEPVADTIRAGSDVREFLDYVKVDRDYTILDAAGREHGRIVRWYHGTGGMQLLKKKLETGKSSQLPGAGTSAIVVSDLPDAFPSDIDIDHYVGAAETLIKAITEPEIKHSHIIPLENLSKAQRAALEVSKVAPADPERCAAINLDRYRADFAACVAGNNHDTMKVLLCRAWFAGQGTLSRGDLQWLADTIDDGTDLVPERGKLVDWIIRKSPYPEPQMVEEHVARAMTWAAENIPPNKRKQKQPPQHTGATTSGFVSDFVTGAVLMRYQKGRDIYRLACAIARINVKIAGGLSEAQICAIIAEVDAFLGTESVVESEAPTPVDEPEVGDEASRPENNDPPAEDKLNEEHEAPEEPDEAAGEDPDDGMVEFFGFNGGAGQGTTQGGQTTPTPNNPPPASGPLILDPGAPLICARAFVGARYTTNNMCTLAHQGALFYAWEQTHYVEVGAEVIRAGAYAFFDKAFRPVKGGVEPFEPNKNKVANILEATAAETQLPASIRQPAWLDTAPHPPATEIVSCTNGLVHLPTRALLPHTPAFFTVNALTYDYQPDAPVPAQWLAFLKTLWPKDQDVVDILQEIFGLLLTSDTSFQKIFMLVGPKRSGKGTIGRILGLLLGLANVCSPTLSSLAERFGMAPLINRRLAIIADARLSGRSDQSIVVERLLSVSGEDAHTIDRKHILPWSGKLDTRFLVLTNELPRFSDASGALASRFITIILTVSFYGREDHGLFAKLATELPGILNWAIVGLDRLRKRGYFIPPKSSEQAQRDLEDLASPIGAFIRQRCEVGPGKRIACSKLFDGWMVWCRDNHRQHHGDLQRFGRDLHAAIAGLTISHPRNQHGKPVGHYEGINLVP